MHIARIVYFVAVALLPITSIHAQTIEAPTPSQIQTAKRVFIGNDGGEFNTSDWTGPSSRTYEQFYFEMKRSGKYELVSNPSDADLVLEVSFVGESACRLNDAQFRLAILDPKTHAQLWTLISHIHNQLPGSRKARDNRFDEALAKLASNFLQLSARQTSGQ